MLKQLPDLSQDFGCNIVRSTNGGIRQRATLEVPRGLDRCRRTTRCSRWRGDCRRVIRCDAQERRRIKWFAQPEVSQAQVAVAADEEVVWFNVSVDVAQGVHYL